MRTFVQRPTFDDLALVLPVAWFMLMVYMFGTAWGTPMGIAVLAWGLLKLEHDNNSLRREVDALADRVRELEAMR